MEFSTVFFCVVVGIFLLGIAISALRVRVMTELDEMDASTQSSSGYLLNPETQSSSGVAESGSDAIDGQQ